MDAIHDLTKTGAYSLEITLKRNGLTTTATYSSFSVANESNKFRLSVSGFKASYFGQGNSLMMEGDSHNGMYFSTRDRDNDDWHVSSSTYDNGYYGSYSGWWFRNVDSCNLNQGDSKGPQFSGYNDESTMILKR